MDEKESAFKKEVVRESKEVSKQVKNVLSKSTGKVKEFSNKDFGKVKGLHIILAAIIIILLVGCISCVGKDDGIAYPLVYTTSDGDVKVLPANGKVDDVIKISSDGASSIVYSNESSRYFLFEKNDNLYLYDGKDTDEQTKILSDVERYTFTPGDKYIVAMNSDHDLYSIVPGKEKEKLDKDINWYLGMTDDKVLYEKDSTLYLRSLKVSKDDRVKIAEDYSGASLSKDNKYVVYIKDDNLYLYNIKKSKSENVAKDVSDYICSEESCEKIIYVKDNDGLKDVYLYNGKKTQKIAKDVKTIISYDIDKEYLLYKNDDGILFFKKGTKDAYKIGDELTSATFIDDSESIVYLNEDDELLIAKVKGAKIGSGKKIGEDIANIVQLDGKVAFVSDVDDNNCGDLFIASNGRSERVDTDVYYELTVNNDGDKVYYLKDYDEYTGNLYYTTASGRKTQLDTDVYYKYKYVRDDLIYYIKDYSKSYNRGDLYRYTGKSVKIDESVRDISREANTGFEYSK